MSDPEPPWYVTAFDQSYLARYSHRDRAEAERQIATLAGPLRLAPGRVVFDLCCGGGRHATLLAQRGCRVVGMDLSQDLLGAASEAGGDHGPRFVRGDMRRLPFGAKSFDAVTQLFTAFGYFEDDPENLAVLREVRRVLRPGGRYALDLMNLAPTVAGLVERSVDVAPDGAEVEQLRRYVAESRRIEKTIITRDGEGREARRRECVRVFDPREIGEWLHGAGLEVGGIIGDYDGAAYDERTSPRMLVLAERR